MPAKDGKRILVLSPRGFLAQAFVTLCGDEFTIITAGRGGGERCDYALDLEHPDEVAGAAAHIAADHPTGLDGVLFLQGVNPSCGARDMTHAHFHRMLSVNLVGPTLLLGALSGTLNPQGCVVFVSSIAATKGSYDPSYAAAKAALGGLVPSLATAYPHLRFNTVTLGLVEGSPVHQGMTPDFVERHRGRMFQGRLVQVENVVRILRECLLNRNLHLADIPLLSGRRE